jgi:DNA polymerase-3 subunit epsilon
LTSIINASAEAFEKMQVEVEDQIRRSKAALKEERNRLAALMSGLPQGVLVCNVDGQILLYNAQAQRLLQQPDRLIGLGRSLFGALERGPVVHALEMLQHAVEEDQVSPTTSFVLNVHDRLTLRVHMAPFLREWAGLKEISGFALTLEDITRQLEGDLQRNLVLRTLAEAMRFSCQEVRDGMAAILAAPGMSRELLADHHRTIDRASLALTDQLDHTATEFARLLNRRGHTETISGNNLVGLIVRQLRRQLDRPVATEVQDDLWLQLDSYGIVQGLAQLALLLKTLDLPPERVMVRLVATESTQALLQIGWEGDVAVPEQLEAWRDRPLIRDAQDRLLSFRELVGLGGGACELLPGGGDGCRGLELKLPTQSAETPLAQPSRAGERPIYFAFDLFNPASWQELGKRPLHKLTMVVFDTETTGLEPSAGDEIIQLGAIRIVNGRILYNEIIDQLVDPGRSVPRDSVEIHGIQPELLRGQPTIDQALVSFHRFCEGSVLVAHNAAFDMKFLQLKEARTGLRFDHPVLDTLLLSWLVHTFQEGHDLNTIARRFNIPVVGRHTALGDAIVTAEVLMKLIPLLEAQGIRTLEDAITASATIPLTRMKY